MAIEPKIDHFQNEQPQPEPLTDTEKADLERIANAPVLTMESSLWELCGIIDDPNGPTDVSTNKHKYLAEAYMMNWLPAEEVCGRSAETEITGFTSSHSEYRKETSHGDETTS